MEKTKQKDNTETPHNSINNNNNATFKLLCPTSLVPKLLGPSNKVIKHLIHSNAAHDISVLNAIPPHCPYRVISITASTKPAKKNIKLSANNSNGNRDVVEEVEVSRVQRTLLRVFEKILESDERRDGSRIAAAAVSCRLLVDRRCFEGLWCVKKGCVVKVFGCDLLLPGFPGADDRVVQIEGNGLAVKKTLLSVSQHLQDCSFSNKTKTPNGGIKHRDCVDTPNNATGCTSRVRPLSTDTTHSITTMLDNNLSCPSAPTCATQIDVPPPGHTLFRLLCHHSLVTQLIGPGGKTIRHLSNSTAAYSIFVINNPSSQCPYRVVSIIALATGNKKIKVTGSTSGSTNSDADDFVEVKISRAQMALLRVFEKILEVGDRDFVELLVDELSIEQLKGTVLEEIKRETGCVIDVIRCDMPLPAGADFGDHVIEIKGNILAVKQALIAVSHLLQNCLLSDKRKIPFGVVHQGSADIPNNSMGCALGNCPSPTDSTNSITSVLDNNMPCPSTSTCATKLDIPLPGYASFRLLCHESLVTKLIGPGGKTIKHLSHSNAAYNISIIDTPPSQCPYQVVSIIALATVNIEMKLTGLRKGITHSDVDDLLEAKVSSAQRALLRVFEKIIEVNDGDNVEFVSCQLLVDKLCIKQLRWTVVEEIKIETGCVVKVLTANDMLLPTCADPGDHVIKIEGNVLTVKRALVAFSHHLQDCQLSDKPQTPFGGVSPQSSTVMPSNIIGCISGACPASIDETPIVEIKDVLKVQSAVSGVAGMLNDNSLPNMPNDVGIPCERLNTAGLSGLGAQDQEVNSSSNPGQHFHKMQDSEQTGISPEGKIFGKLSLVTDTLSHVAGNPVKQFWNILNSARTSYGRQRFTGPAGQDSAINNSPNSAQDIADIHNPDDSETSLKAGSKIGSVTVLNVRKKVKLEVPEHVTGFVCGENDSNLINLRQISGAHILLHEPCRHTNHRILVISGNPEDVDLALELLQQYILTNS